VGGAEQVCLDLADAQRQQGHEVRLFVFVRGGVSEDASRLGVDFIVPEVPAEAGRGRRRSIIAACLLDVVREFLPDVVHSHVPLTHLICNRVLPGTSVPWIATMHGSWRQFAYAPKTVGRPYLRPYLLLRHSIGDFWSTRSAARIVAPSEYVKRQLREVGVEESRIVVIHNGLRPPEQPITRDAARRALAIPEGSVVIGALGHLAPVKGFDILIKAAALLVPRHPHVRVLIGGGDVLGDDRPRRSLDDLTARLRLEDHVRLLGPVKPREGFFSALDVFVVSSRTEGLPLSLLDAMHHGLPSVVSSTGGMVEAARPATESLAFRSGDVCSLAPTLERLITDSDLRGALGIAASARASTYLTLSRCAAEYDGVYLQARASSRGSR